MTDQQGVSDATLEEERADATHDYTSGRGPTSEESEAAERGCQATKQDAKSVADHYAEMTEIGANVRGEGAVD
jgi:hypothetical protein